MKFEDILEGQEFFISERKCRFKKHKGILKYQSIIDGLWHVSCYKPSDITIKKVLPITIGRIKFEDVLEGQTFFLKVSDSLYRKKNGRVQFQNRETDVWEDSNSNSWISTLNIDVVHPLPNVKPFKIGDFVTDEDEYLKVTSINGEEFDAYNIEEEVTRYGYNNLNFTEVTFDNVREGQHFKFEGYTYTFKKKRGSLYQKNRLHEDLWFIPSIPKTLKNLKIIELTSNLYEEVKIEKPTKTKMETKMTNLYQTKATPTKFGSKVATTDSGKVVLQMQDGSNVMKEFSPNLIKRVTPYTVEVKYPNLSLKYISRKGQVSVGDLVTTVSGLGTVTHVDTDSGEGHPELEGRVFTSKVIK